jgi:hypothetical protein
MIYDTHQRSVYGISDWWWYWTHGKFQLVLTEPKNVGIIFFLKELLNSSYPSSRIRQWQRRAAVRIIRREFTNFVQKDNFTIISC